MFSCTQSTQGKCSQMLHIFSLTMSTIFPDTKISNNFWLHHTIYQPRKELWFITTIVVVSIHKSLKSDWEFHVARADNVLDFEVCELGWEIELLNNPCILPCCELRSLLTLGSCAHHLSWHKNECCCLRVANSHNYGSKKCINTLSTTKISPSTN